LKQLTFKWLKRLWTFIAANLIVIALILTIARVASTDINVYKVKLIQWIAAEYDINVSVDDISAGIDFSGLVLTLENVRFVDAPLLPFKLELKHLFLHLDFINSLKEKELVFNDISLKGADLTLKSFQQTQSIESSLLDQTSTQLTVGSLKDIFLSRLNSFSIKDSQLNFTDHLSIKKTIYIQDLSWFNRGERHQGVGKASLSGVSNDNNLEFLINISGDAKGDNSQLLANLYAHADNLNLQEYLQPQINPLATLKKAKASFKLWGEFDFNGPKHLQVELGRSDIAWELLGESHDWQLKQGLLQFSYQDYNWLFDTYDLNFDYNYVPWPTMKLSGKGVGGQSGHFDLAGVNLNTITPFALLFSTASQSQIETVKRLEIGGDVNSIDVTVDKPGELTIRTNIDAFNNQAVGAIPGISDADMVISANQDTGRAHITLSPQNINFDQQLNRAIPVKQGDLWLNWAIADEGITVSSEKSALVTDDIDSLTQFSLFIPQQGQSERQPFLSLYSYVSVNDASKAQHYFPINAMGQDVYDYLQPTVSQGEVTGAKVLWYGALSDYPYAQQQGVFQAFIPVKNAHYNFYEGWQGLTDLDIDLLFENDRLSMHSSTAKLGAMQLQDVVGQVDHLTADGVIEIKGKVVEEGEKVAQYIANTPLKENVGEALKVINIHKPIQGDIEIRIPLDSANGDPLVTGVLDFEDNDVDLELSDALTIPFKQVTGQLRFNNGEVNTKGMSAALFEQPVDFSFYTTPLADQFQMKMDLSGQWNAETLTENRPELSILQLGGKFDWQGDVAFTQFDEGGFQYQLNLSSPLQGMKTDLPSPYNKNPLQTWLTDVEFSGDEATAKWDATISNKVKFEGALDYQTDQTNIPYLYLGLGNAQRLPIDQDKQVIRIHESETSLTAWMPTILELVGYNQSKQEKQQQEDADSLLTIDDIYVNVKQSELFNEPLTNVNTHIQHQDKLWTIDTQSSQTDSHVEYREGIPDRYDINVKRLQLDSFDIDAAHALFFPSTGDALAARSENLREDYPEVFLECETCLYQKMNLSHLSAHVFPSKSRYTIDYLRFGEEDKFTHLSGVWDQRRTNIIVDSKENSDTSLLHRLGYATPVLYQQADVSGALNWIGAPWQFNLPSLSGVISAELENGMITEVNDNGARLLSFLSLDAIRRSLNLEYGNVFSKGLGFDSLSFSSNITNGIVKSDDFYLDGSAGKIAGGGLIDLPNFSVNYRLSYSPAVTSSLPVLAAFAVNPLTGAAVLMLTKLLEPVVDTIIRIDFSVKGVITDPVVKIESSEKGKIKLQNSAVLEALENQQAQEQ